MFYPEFSPAMKWHQLHNQRLYSNFVFPNCATQFKDEEQNFGKLWNINLIDPFFLMINTFPLINDVCLVGEVIVVINISQSQHSRN